MRQQHFLINKCPGPNYGSSCPHGSIVVFREASNQSTTCYKCHLKKKNDKISDENRKKNWNAQTAPNSSTPWIYLNDEQTIKRRRNQAVEKQRKKREIERFKRELKEKDELLQQPVHVYSPTDDDEDTKKEAIGQISKDFKNQMKHELEHVIKNFDGTYKELLKETLVQLLQHGVDSKKSNKIGYEFKVEDVDDLVETLKEQCVNQVEVLTGNKKQVRFLSRTWEVVHSLYSKSASTYHHHTGLNPLIYPNESSIKKVRTFNRVRDGRDFTTFEKRQARNDRKGIENEHLFAMFDEMQLKSAVKFSTQTGEPVGLENDCQDLKQVLHRLLAPDGEKQAPAKKVNQWLFEGVPMRLQLPHPIVF